MERRAVGVWVVEDRGEDGRAGGLRHHAADLGLQMEQGDRDSGILFPLVPGARIRDWRVLDGREQARLRSSRWHARTSATMREARPPRKDLSHFFRSRKATMRHAFHVHQKFRATELKMGYLGGLGHLCGLWLEFRPESLRCLGRSGFAPACPAGSTIHQHTTQLSDNIRPRDYLPKVEPPNVNLLNAEKSLRCRAAALAGCGYLSVCQKTNFGNSQ